MRLHNYLFSLQLLVILKVFLSRSVDPVVDDKT